MRIFTTKLIAFIIVALAFTGKVNAQLSGTYAVPATYTSIAAVISDLNSFGVSGPVTINISAGYTETAPVGGYTLTATGTAANPIIFQKNGVGANPLVTAYTGGTGTPGTAVQDGVFRLVGSDYVTFDGIDITDPNAANPATMEFGYGLFKASATDGSQFNTIKNCVITLNRINNAVGTTPAVDGSRGIDVVNALTGAHITGLTVTSSAGTNSNNKFYSNTIQNCNIGIALIGYADVSPFTNADTGNDVGGSSSATGNTIINYGGGGTTNPAAAVRTLAQYNINISYNTINNNNGSGVNHATTLRGIFVNTATSANVSVLNNTITVKSGATTSNLTAIENAAGSTAASNAVNINGNLITGCQYPAATTGVFTGIVNSASSATLSVSNNTFTSNSTAATGGTHFHISNTGAVTSAINLNGNLINGFTFTAAAAGTMHYISNASGASTTALSMSNNTFQAISHSVAGSTTHNFVRNTSATLSQTLNNNTFVNLVLNTTGSISFLVNDVALPAGGFVNASNNMIVTGFNKTGAGGTVFLYQTSTTPSSATGTTKTEQNNNFSNITLTGATTMSGWTDLEGAPGPTKLISSNTFTNWTCGSSGVTVIQTNWSGNNTSISSNTISGISGTGAITGISIGASSGGALETISNNIISGLSGGAAVVGITGGSSSITTLNMNGNQVSGLSGTGASNVYGINLTSGSTVNIFGNKIYNIQGNNAGATASGIVLGGGTTVNTYNNLIGDIRTPASNLATPLTGISVTGGTTQNISYNSVYLNGTSSGALFGSAALLASTTPNVNLRNNILVNISTPNGTGMTVAYQRSSTTLTTYSSTSNNNLFYAGTPGTNRIIFYDGTTAQQTIGAFKTLVSPRDAASVTENPPFASTAGATANFLNINTATPTQIESGAAPVAGITTDFAGTTRNATTPDIGAWEGNFTLADFSAPTIAGITGTTSACNLTSRTFTATISDASGVATGALAPRIYYKVNAGAYTSVQGTLVSGTVNSGVWSFVLTYAAANLDVISYFVVAQDVAGTPNLGASPSAGFAGTDVNTVTTPPTTPNTYQVGALNGTYTVGSGGNFTTLTAAANAYNTLCLTGPVTFVLTDALYSTAETFPVIFLNNANASSTNSLLIVPNTGVNAVVSGSTTATSVIKFLNARYITIDGLNTGGSSLTLTNPNTGTSADIWIASTTGTGPGCNTIGLKNMTLNGGSNTATQYGIISGVDGASPSTTGGSDNDNITISGNNILKNYYGIYANGTASVTTGGLDNWAISSNTIGPVTSGANNIGFAGIYLQNMLNLSISSNLVRNIITSSTANGGIYLASGINTAAVSQNTVNMVTTSSTGSGSSAISGMYFGLNVINSTISQNVVTSVYNSNTSGYGARGIMFVTGVTASNDILSNNMISDIVSYSDASAIYWPIGIALEAGTGGIGIYYNTINLYGSHSGLSSSTGAAALYVNTGSTAGLNIRSNIFANTYDNTGSTSESAFGVYSTSSISSFSVMNYNDYYVGGSAPTLALGYLGGNLTTLAAIQTGFGGNANSINVAPVFTSNTDLHLIPASNVSLDNLGTPISGITVDIDSQSRNATTPDMGADEFTSPVCTGANGGTLSSASITKCAGQTASLVSTGFSTGVNTTYQWMMSTTPGGPYTNVTGGTGATGTSYTTAALTAGTYYYVLQTVCSAASATATSNEGTVTVNANPSIAVSPSSATVCVPGSVSLTASGSGTSYSWGPSTGLSGTTGAAVTASPVITTVYTVTATGGGCSTSTTVPVVAAQNPTVSATISSSVVCAGGTSSLTATSNYTPYIVSPINYAPIATPGSGVTTLCNNGTAVVPQTVVSLDDGGWSNITLPFTFNFFGTNYTSFAVSTNGFIYLGTGSPVSFSNYGIAFPSTTPAKPSIGAVYADLDFDGVGSGSKIEYFTVGTSPNQKLVVNWTGQFYNNTGTVTAQAILYETSNVVEVHTYTSTGTNAGVQGIQNAAGTGAFVVNGRNATNWTVTTPDAYRWTPGSISSYNWSPSTFLSASNIANPVANNANTTTAYNVTVTANSGCSANAAVTLSVNPNPTVTIAAGSSSICSGAAASFTASGASTYSWSTGAATAVMNDSPVTATTYTVNGTTSGCNGTATVALAVVTTPTVVASASSSTLCSGYSATLSATGAPSYSWSTGATTASIVDSPSSTTSYTVTGNNGGCTGMDVVTVSVTPSPTVVPSTSSFTICSGSNATLTATGATTYSWSSGATGSVTVESPAVSTTFSVTGTSAGCTGLGVVTVSVIATPTVAASASSPSVCSGVTATLSATGAPSYSWSTGGTTASITDAPSSTTSYTVIGDNNGCTGMDIITLSVTTTPTVTTAATSTAICSGNSATLTASGASTYSWSTGAMTASITGSPSSTTTYTVTGDNGGGCIAMNVITLSVTTTPTVTIAASSPSVCSGVTATLTASGAPSYSWSTGGTTASITDTPSSTTTYTVVGDNSGCTGMDVITLSVTTTPTVTTAATSTAICSGNSATLTASGASTYSWSTGAMTASITDSPSTTTTYSVTGDNGGGCTATDVITLSVTTTPTLATSASSSTLCSGTSATLTASGAATYSWSTGGNTASITDSPSSTTTYTVTGDNGGGCTATDVITLTVTTTPTVTASASMPFICIGFSSTLTATGATTYTWSSGPVAASTVESPSVTTTYTVNGENSGCFGMDVITLTVNPNPTVTAVASSTAVCAGSNATLTASGATTYSWSSGAATAVTVESPTVNTTYTVTGDNGGCTSTAVVSVNVNALPVVSAMSSDTLICAGTSVTLTATGANTYTWSSGAIGASTVESPTVTMGYTVTGTDANGCENTDTLTQMVSPCLGISASGVAFADIQVYPNPNHGMINIVVPDVTGNVSFELYDAIGRLVMSMTLTQNHTQLKTTELPGGVYTYRIKSGSALYQQGKLVRE